MNHRVDRLLSILIGIIIISYGILGPLVMPTYQAVVEGILGDELTRKLQPVFAGNLPHDIDRYNLGKYLLYYPSYIGLHVALLSALFRKAPKSRNIGILFMLIGLPLIAGLAFISHLLGWTIFYDAVKAIFHNIVGYPFILFIVEGGRVLNVDIDKLLKQKSQQ